MRSRSLALLCGLAGACSFDSSGSPGTADGPLAPAADAALTDAARDPSDGAPVPDAPRPALDGAAPDAGAPATIGAPCPLGVECGAGQLCLGAPEGWGEPGYCTAPCSSGADCGDDAFCSPDLGGFRLCVAACDDGACGAGQVCTRQLAGVIDLGQRGCLPGDDGAADGDPCASFADCAGGQFCLDNPFEAPGGECLTLGCEPGDDDTCADEGDGVCLLVSATFTACFDACASDDDCREAEGYACLAGAGVCYYPHADPGAACSTNAECGLAPWRCLKGAGFPGGYCGGLGCDPADDATCPSGTVCYDASPGSLDGTEHCAAVCAGDDDCRGTAGYRCRPAGAGLPSVCRLP